MTSPLVSVCIPAYNIEAFLAYTIESVIGQAYKNIEIIIVDDGSTDDTLAIAKKFEGPKVRVFSQTNCGASTARNTAYRYSTGRYIKFLDGDDIINPEMISSQVELAEQNDSCLISGKWGRFYNNDISTFKLSPEPCWQTMPAIDWLCSSWKNGDSMTQSGIFLIPRSILEENAPWNERLSLIDDMEFFTRVILRSPKVVFDANSILHYRSGVRGSLSSMVTDQAISSAFTAIDLSTKNLLAKSTTPETKEACANLWQTFLYDIYPKHKKITQIAGHRIAELGGATIKFKCGGLTKILYSVVGWKLTKQIKYFIGGLK